MTNDNSAKCALPPTMEQPSRACTHRGFSAQFDERLANDKLHQEELVTC